MKYLASHYVRAKVKSGGCLVVFGTNDYGKASMSMSK